MKGRDRKAVQRPFSGFYQFLGHIKSVLVHSVHGWMVNFTDE